MIAPILFEEIFHHTLRVSIEEFKIWIQNFQYKSNDKENKYHSWIYEKYTNSMEIVYVFSTVINKIPHDDPQENISFIDFPNSENKNKDDMNIKIIGTIEVSNHSDNVEIIGRSINKELKFLWDGVGKSLQEQFLPQYREFIFLNIVGSSNSSSSSANPKLNRINKLKPGRPCKNRGMAHS